MNALAQSRLECFNTREYAATYRLTSREYAAICGFEAKKYAATCKSTSHEYAAVCGFAVDEFAAVCSLTNSVYSASCRFHNTHIKRRVNAVNDWKWTKTTRRNSTKKTTYLSSQEHVRRF